MTDYADTDRGTQILPNPWLDANRLDWPDLTDEDLNEPIDDYPSDADPDNEPDGMWDAFDAELGPDDEEDDG